MIRQLRRGERLPAGEPRRYIAGHGYVRLRWRLASGDYVETYEHRVDGDRVTTAEHVHHKNRDRRDNRPENLAPLAVADHAREHQVVDRKEAARLYHLGLSTVAIARRLNCNPATISRALRKEGVAMRPPRKLDVVVDEVALRTLHAMGMRVPAIAREIGVGEGSIRRAMRDLGLPSFPAGRPRRDTA